MIEDYEHMIRPFVLGFNYLVQFYEYLTNVTYVLVSYLFYYIGLRKKPSQGMSPNEDYHPGVFITGATSGIGRQSTIQMANAGYTVYATYRNKKRGQKLLSDFENQYEGTLEKKGRVILVELDLDKDGGDGSISGSLSNCFKEVSRDLQTRGIPLKSIVNNAGFCTMSAIELTSKSDIDAQFHLVFDSYIQVIKMFLPLLKQSKGRIINVNSVGSYTIIPGFGAYCAAKAAMQMVTLSMRMELSRYDVTVSSVDPGFTVAKSLYSNALCAFSKYYGDETATGVNSQGEVTHSDDRGHGQNSSEYVESTTRDYKVMMDDWFFLLRLFRLIGQPTSNVALNILHAVSASYAKPVYISGFDARVYDLAQRFVPEDIIEWTVGKLLFPSMYKEKEQYTRAELKLTVDKLIDRLKKAEPQQDTKDKDMLRETNVNVEDSFDKDYFRLETDISPSTSTNTTGISGQNDVVSSPLAGKMNTSAGSDSASTGTGKGVSSPVIIHSSTLKGLNRKRHFEETNLNDNITTSNLEIH